MGFFSEEGSRRTRRLFLLHDALQGEEKVHLLLEGLHLHIQRAGGVIVDDRQQEGVLPLCVQSVREGGESVAVPTHTRRTHVVHKTAGMTFTALQEMSVRGSVLAHKQMREAQIHEALGLEGVQLRPSSSLVGPVQTIIVRGEDQKSPVWPPPSAMLQGTFPALMQHVHAVQKLLFRSTDRGERQGRSESERPPCRTQNH